MPGLFVQALIGKPTQAEWEAGKFCFEHPVLGNRYVMLLQVSPASGRDSPDEGFRKAISARMETQRGRVVALGYAVVVGPVMLGATTRAIITAISMLTKPNHAEKAFGDVQATADWLHEQMPQGQTPRAMVEALEGLVALQAPAGR